MIPSEVIFDYLEANGFQDLDFEGFDDDGLQSGITIVTEAGRRPQAFNPLRYYNISIYVKRSSKQAGYEQAEAIRNLLKDKGGSLTEQTEITFYPIQILTEPYQYGENIWLLRIEGEYIS